ncbi:translation initiation factor IF-2 [Patescibacteria group bacterium]|nr:translation initiation factor IF-2 [Patescibacteria group bacterium]
MAESAQEAPVVLPSVLSVKELAETLERPVPDVMSALIKNGVMATINQDIDFETASIIASDLGIAVEAAPDEEKQETATTVKPTEGKPRPPIVTVLGHVDHGKTSLLDAIRQTDVVAKESGGITQHIGAYQVEAKPAKGKPQLVTFLDTPGHEAFTAMRAHGTKMTDVAILVVAADDGVKPQTVEAIDHIKEAGVPFLVAVTKMDSEGADVNKVKQELAERKVIAEDWGGDVVFAQTSAKKGEGIPELLELVLLISDLAEPKGDPDGDLSGVVIESRLSRAKGAVATILVQQGTLKVGDYLVLEDVTGRVRLMEDWHGKRVTEATPGTPVQVAGLSGVPSYGSAVIGAKDEKDAKAKSELNRRQQHAKRLNKPKLSVEAIKRAVDAGKVKRLPIVLMADVKGSLDAIENSLSKLSQDEVAISLVHTGVGTVSENDVRTAESAGAMIVSFRARVEPTAAALAKQLGVQVSNYDVIYELLDDVTVALETLLSPEIIVNEVGKGEVLAIFRTTKKNQIIGCKVTSGKFVAGSEYRIGDSKESGTVKKLQKVDETVEEVASGTECGLTIDGPQAEVGQKVTLFRTITKPRKLKPVTGGK